MPDPNRSSSDGESSESEEGEGSESEEGEEEDEVVEEPRGQKRKWQELEEKRPEDCTKEELLELVEYWKGLAVIRQEGVTMVYMQREAPQEEYAEYLKKQQRHRNAFF